MFVFLIPKCVRGIIQENVELCVGHQNSRVTLLCFPFVRRERCEETRLPWSQTKVRCSREYGFTHFIPGVVLGRDLRELRSTGQAPHTTAVLQLSESSQTLSCPEPCRCVCGQPASSSLFLRNF
jgi:hypothetical protein